VSDSLIEQELFDDPPKNANNTATSIKTTELLEPPPTFGDIGTDWSDFELIEDLIGSGAAWKIAEAFAGSNIYIPKSILTNKNYLEIRRKFKAGATYREISVEYGYTETHIRNIIHRK
jgi:hypothetical protein